MKSICLLTFIITYVVLINSSITDAGQLVAPGLQLIPSREGYIPVYIVDGNTPLEEVNPQLAEAFRAHEKKYSIPKGKRIGTKQYVAPKTLQLLLNGFKYGDKDKDAVTENVRNEEKRQPKTVNFQSQDGVTSKPHEAKVYRINFNVPKQS